MQCMVAPGRLHDPRPASNGVRWSALMVLVQVAFGLSLPQGVGYVLGGGERASGLRLTGLAEPLPVGSF